MEECKQRHWEGAEVWGDGESWGTLLTHRRHSAHFQMKEDGGMKRERRGQRAAPWHTLQKQPTWGAPRQALASPASILVLPTNMKLRLKNRLVAKPHPFLLFFQGLSPPNSLQRGSHSSALLEAGVLPLWGDWPASNPPPRWQLRETAGPLSGPDPAEGPTGLSLLSVNN